MRWAGATALIGLLAGSANGAAQDSFAWLTGRWSEQVPTKGRIAGGVPMVLQIEIENEMLRVVDGAEDGNDLRCRVDGAETRSTQMKSKARIDDTLKCKISKSSVEIRGRTTTSGMSGIPPQQYEIDEKYELAKDGSLRARLRFWGLVQGLGPIDVADVRTSFSRAP